MIRTTAGLLGAFAAMLVVAGAGMAGSADDPEIEDATGDAGPYGVGLAPLTDDFDIVRVWFEPAADGQGTWVAMELTSFDVHPPDVLFGVYAPVDEGWFGVGFGQFVLTEAPFLAEGYGGCHGASVDEGPQCGQLEGEPLPDRPGFRLLLPPEWAPAGAFIGESYAAVMWFPMAPVPADTSAAWALAGPVMGATMLDSAGPGRTLTLSAPEPGGADIVEVSSTATEDRNAVGALPVALGIVGLAAAAAISTYAVRRR